MPISRSVSSGPAPASGSSSSSRRGCMASAMASSSCRFSPWRQRAGRHGGALGEPDLRQRRHGRARSARPRRGGAEEAEGGAAARLHRQRHVLQRGEAGHDGGDLEAMRARPSRARRRQRASRSRPARRRGSARHRARSVPLIWWISVVLPAPFGPMTAWISPGATSSETSSVTASPPKRLRRPTSREHRLSHRRAARATWPAARPGRRAGTARPAPAAARRSAANAR